MTLVSKGTPHFSAARILDFSYKPITFADDIESFFHMLIYYAVHLLKHNIPSGCVDPFQNEYFETTSGMTQNGKFTAPALKRESMHTGTVSLEFCGLDFMSESIPYSDSPRDLTSGSGVTPLLNYDHPLNELVHTLLPWFGAVCTLDRLNATVIPDPSQACLGGRVPLLDDDSEDEDDDLQDNLAVDSGHRKPLDQLFLDDMRKLRTFAAKLDGHKEVLKLFKWSFRQLSSASKSEDKPSGSLTDANMSAGQNGRPAVELTVRVKEDSSVPHGEPTIAPPPVASDRMRPSWPQWERYYQ